MGSPASEEGRFSCPNEGPVHRVTIGQAFAVGVYEVTFAEWDACVNGGGCNGYRPADEGWGREQRPVISVSWEDAQAYVQWVSEKTGKPYRLLSEAEWEYMARAGTTTARYWGEGEAEQCRYANGADQTAKQYNRGWTVVACDDGHHRTAPVGSYAANGFGLYDVLGNVWEWVQDCWNESYTGAPSDGSLCTRPRGSEDHCYVRVLRGGAWSSGPRYLRSAYRDRIDLDLRNVFIGFRIARALP